MRGCSTGRRSPEHLEWFAGYAAIVAAEFYRRGKELEKAESAYDRAVALFDTGNRESAGVEADRRPLRRPWPCRAAPEWPSKPAPWRNRCSSCSPPSTRSPKSGGKVDGLNQTPMDTAQKLQAKLKEAQQPELLARLTKAIDALPAEAFELPAFERNLGSAPKQVWRNGRMRRRGWRDRAMERSLERERQALEQAKKRQRERLEREQRAAAARAKRRESVTTEIMISPVPGRSLAARLLTAGLLATPLAAQLPQPPRAADENPDPRVFETVLVASERLVQLVPGRKTRLLTFNGSMPGPTLEVRVGDRVVVHLVNLLKEPTSIHWHGIETPAAMDGSQLSQNPVPPSGHFRYEFVASNAGTFWYHPHINTSQQVEQGLYGAVIVRDPAQERRLGIPRAQETLLFLDDIKLDEHNQVAPFASDGRSTYVPWKRAEDLVNSRVGTHRLINGRTFDPKNPPTLPVRAHAPHRLRMLSVTNGHLWRLSIASQPATVYGIGSDQGLWNEAEVVRPITKVKDNRGHHDLMISDIDPEVGITLTPSDRFEAVVVPRGKPGTEFVLEGHDFIKGKHIAFRSPDGELRFGHDHFDGASEPEAMLRFKITGQDENAWTPPQPLRPQPIQRLAVDLEGPALPVFFGHSQPHKDTGDVMFFLNVDRAGPLLADVRKRKVLLPVDYLPLPMMRLGARDGYQVGLGETRYFEVVNFTGSDHNFHLHGFAFQHVDTTFHDVDEPANNRRVKARRLAYEDTIRLPKRPGLVLGRSYTVMRLAVRFDDSHRPKALRRRPDQLLASGLTPGQGRSGGWLVHCHFLEHGARGMMSFVAVRPGKTR